MMSAPRLSPARNRKFADSPLEETVRSELVSEMGPAAAKLTRDSSVFMDDNGSQRARFRAHIRWKLVLVAPWPVLRLPS
jgi:hypothetical protein